MTPTRMRRAASLAALTVVALPGAATAMPIRDPVVPPDAQPSKVTTLVREVPADEGSQTLALILSGAALVVAAGAAARTITLRPAMAAPAAPTSPRPGGRQGR
jgi:hypothetical protein